MGPLTEAVLSAGKPAGIVALKTSSALPEAMLWMRGAIDVSG